MKKKMRSLLALALCLMIFSAALAGCGEEKPKTTLPAIKEVATQPTKAQAPAEAMGEPDDAYSISAYYNNDELEVSLNFYDDFTVTYTDSELYVEGAYYFEGEDLYMVLDEELYEGYFADEGVISIFDVDGYFYEGNDVYYYPSEDRLISDGGTEANKTYEDMGDGTTYYHDYGGLVCAKYPDWMDNWEDEIMPGSVLIGDGEGGYVLGINVSDAYWDYEGYDDDFMMELYNDQIITAFEYLYGNNWECDRVTHLQDSRDLTVAAAEANIYNDDNDIMVYTRIYRTTKNDELTNSVIAKVYFYDYGNESQLQQLKENVTKVTGIS